MSLVVFPFKDEDPEVATANVRIAASHPRVSAVLCVGSGPDAAYQAIDGVAPEIERTTGSHVELILQARLGTRRPGKGDAMNTGLAWFLSQTDYLRVHFYDADITSFSASWITRAEMAADDGFPVVRHFFPRASTDAMITWFITKPGLAMQWPGTVLPRIEQPLGGELLFTREAAKYMADDLDVRAQSDWGIDTRLSVAAAAGGFPTAEVYIPEGKLHRLYTSLTDIEEMAVECFAAIQEAAGTVVATGVDHRVDQATVVSEEVKRKVAYSVGASVGLLRDGWTEAQLELLDLFPVDLAEGMRAGRTYPWLGFLDADLWGDTFQTFLVHFDSSSREWRRLLFRTWVARVLSYTVTEAVRGYDAALEYLRATIDGYESNRLP